MANQPNQLRLSVTFHQANNLSNPIKWPGRLVSPYVKYSLVKSDGTRTPTKTTNPHKQGSTDPVWGYSETIDLPEDALVPGVYNFVAKIKHNSSIYGCDRRMGFMSIPLADMCVTRNRFPYMVTTKKGIACGTLLLSHSVAGQQAAAAAVLGDEEVVAATTAVAAPPPGAVPLAPVQAQPPLPPRPQAPPIVNPNLANATYVASVLDHGVNIGANVADMILFD
uniref:uncharacterized protein LOC122588976 n=1 Tax=Erigeron canadensis TaxID=72917 RepID=UPI001CB945F8|nr:uncharacterized protein LOC122588976 [Erigeron canadensis]